MIGRLVQQALCNSQTQHSSFNLPSLHKRASSRTALWNTVAKRNKIHTAQSSLLSVQNMIAYLKHPLTIDTIPYWICTSLHGYYTCRPHIHWLLQRLHAPRDGQNEKVCIFRTLCLLCCVYNCRSFPEKRKQKKRLRLFNKVGNLTNVNMKQVWDFPRTLWHSTS